MYHDNNKNSLILRAKTLKHANHTLKNVWKVERLVVFGRFVGSVKVQLSLHTCYFGVSCPQTRHSRVARSAALAACERWSVRSGTCEGESHGEAGRTLNLWELPCTQRCERRRRGKYANVVLLSVKHVNVSRSQEREEQKEMQLFWLRFHIRTLCSQKRRSLCFVHCYRTIIIRGTWTSGDASLACVSTLHMSVMLQWLVKAEETPYCRVERDDVFKKMAICTCTACPYVPSFNRQFVIKQAKAKCSQNTTASDRHYDALRQTN